MTSDSDKIDQLANIFRERNFSEPNTQCLAQAVLEGEGGLIVAELFRLERVVVADFPSEGDMDWLAACRVMDALQALTERDMITALILMAHLYPIACPLYLNDICDSIDLWMGHNQSEELRYRLTDLISREPDESLKKYYEQWWLE